MLRALTLQVLLAQAPLGGEPDWFASLHTEEGVELRSDDRVFTLFALFNAVGLDEGAVVRVEPVPRMTYPKVRELVRARVMGRDGALRDAAQGYLDAHPGPIAGYLAHVIQASAAKGGRPRASAPLEGLDELLARAWERWSLADLAKQARAAQREELKAWLPVLDGPLRRALRALRAPPSTEVVVLGNLLDAPGSVRAVEDANGRVYLVVGPRRGAVDPEALVRELARLRLSSVVARHAARWAAGPEVLEVARLAGAPERSVEVYATQALCAAVSLYALEAPDARWDELAAAGYPGIRDAARLLDDAKPLDGWVLDALHRLETRRPAKK